MNKILSGEGAYLRQSEGGKNSNFNVFVSCFVQVSTLLIRGVVKVLCTLCIHISVPYRRSSFATVA